jgi:hypothetical protein
MSVSTSGISYSCVDKYKSGDTVGLCSSNGCCAENLAIDLVNGKCVDMFNIAEGGQCTGYDQCKPGFVCDFLGSTPPKCVKADKYTYKKCKQDSDCVNSSTCSCNPYNGNSYCPQSALVAAGDKQYKAMLDCYAKYSCGTGVDFWKKSCQQKHCGSKTNAYVKATSCSHLSDTGGKCYYTAGICSGLAGWAIAVIIIVIVIVVIIVAALLFWLLCKRGK